MAHQTGFRPTHCFCRRAVIISPQPNIYVIPLLMMDPVPRTPLQKLLLALCLGFCLLTAPALTAAEKDAPAPAQPPAIVAPETPAPLINLDKFLRPAVNEEGEVVPESSFGTRLLDWLAATGRQLSHGVDKYFGTMADLTLISKWYNQQSTTPRLIERWLLIGQQLGIVALFGTLVTLALHFLLTPARRAYRARHPRHFLHKCALNAIQLGLGLLPVLFFVGTALYLLGELAPPPLERLVILSIVYAVAGARIILLLGQFVLAPRADHLRLLPCGHRRATQLYSWLRALTYLIVYGYFFAEAARLLNVPAEPRAAFVNLLGLAAMVMAIALIRSQRAAVAAWLRGDVKTGTGDIIDWARQNLADSWHRLMILYLVVGYSVTSFNAEGGFIALLRGTLITLGVFIGVNFILYGLNARARRAAKVAADGGRLPLHQPVLFNLLRLVAIAGGIFLALLGWNVEADIWLAGGVGQRLFGAALSIAVAIVAAVICYELICAISGGRSRQRGYDPSAFDRQARMRTLLPLIRHSAALLLSVVVVLVSLDQIGVNIGPLLAGAGIIGVAVGFGSQALVKDIITGLFIIIEDTVHVGDVVACGGHSGAVESMSIRTMRLRDTAGALHILPYSEVTGLINKTRGFAYAVIEIGVAYQTDIPSALRVMEQTGLELQKDPSFSVHIMAAPEVVAGILAFGDSAVTLRCRIKTLPGKQWDIRHAYQLRLKTAFEQAGITIPFPTITHLFEGDTPKPSPRAQLERSLRAAPPPPAHDDERDS